MGRILIRKGNNIEISKIEVKYTIYLRSITIRNEPQ